MLNESDAEVLARVGRRLFEESREAFRAAHEKAIESFNAQTQDDQLRKFGEAVEAERRAISKQREAGEVRQGVLEERAKDFSTLKTAAE